jgi:hypothetical protein
MSREHDAENAKRVSYNIMRYLLKPAQSRVRIDSVQTQCELLALLRAACSPRNDRPSSLGSHGYGLLRGHPDSDVV